MKRRYIVFLEVDEDKLKEETTDELGKDPYKAFLVELALLEEAGIYVEDVTDITGKNK